MRYCISICWCAEEKSNSTIEMFDGSTHINFVHVSTIPWTERNPEKQGSTPEVQYFLSVLSRSPGVRGQQNQKWNKKNQEYRRVQDFWTQVQWVEVRNIYRAGCPGRSCLYLPFWGTVGLKLLSNQKRGGWWLESGSIRTLKTLHAVANVFRSI